MKDPSRSENKFGAHCGKRVALDEGGGRGKFRMAEESAIVD